MAKDRDSLDKIETLVSKNQRWFKPIHLKSSKGKVAATPSHRGLIEIAAYK